MKNHNFFDDFREKTSIILMCLLLTLNRFPGPGLFTFDSKQVIIPSRHLSGKVNNRNTRTRCEIAWRHSGIFIVNFEHISHPAVVFLLLILKM